MSTIHPGTTVLGKTFVLIGAALAASAVLAAWQTSVFIRQASVVRGRVVGLEWRNGTIEQEVGMPGSERSGGGYVTVFSFADASGQSHTNRTEGAQNPATHRVGEMVEVLLPTGHPEKARIRSFQTLWLSPVLLLLVGSVFAAAGGYAVRTSQKTSNTP